MSGSASSSVSVLFVCLGNICRSPTAHGIFQGLIERADLCESIFVDSCGTGDWHIGHSPDARSTAAAKKRGYDLSRLISRQVASADFDRFDYILAMDENNLDELRAMAPSNYKGVLDLFLLYASENSVSDVRIREVPDPYYGGSRGFETVLDLVEKASENLLARITSQHGL